MRIQISNIFRRYVFVLYFSKKKNIYISITSIAVARLMFLFLNPPRVKQFALRCAYCTTDSFVSTSFKLSAAVEKRGEKHNVITVTIERFFAIFHFFFHLRILKKKKYLHLTPSSHIPSRLAHPVRHYVFPVDGKLYISYDPFSLSISLFFRVPLPLSRNRVIQYRYRRVTKTTCDIFASPIPVVSYDARVTERANRLNLFATLPKADLTLLMPDRGTDTGTANTKGWGKRRADGADNA